MLRNKKGLSVIVGSMLLIAIGVAMGAAVFLWAGDFVSRLSPPIDCSGVGFESEMYKVGNAYYLDIINTDDIPIKGIVIKSVSKGEVKTYADFDLAVEPGATKSVILNFMNIGNEGDNFLIIPKISVKGADEKELISVCLDSDGYETQYRAAIVRQIPIIDDEELIVD